MRSGMFIKEIGGYYVEEGCYFWGPINDRDDDVKLVRWSCMMTACSERATMCDKSSEPLAGEVVNPGRWETERFPVGNV